MDLVARHRRSDALVVERALRLEPFHGVVHLVVGVLGADEPLPKLMFGELAAGEQLEA
jgi:hypothetical protein